MKVLILAPIAHDFPPKGYGPWELVSYNLAEALVEIGVDVSVFATKSANTKASVFSYWDKPLEFLEGVDSRVYESIHIVEALKKAKDFDIVHNHLNIHPVLYNDLVKVPMVTTLHGAACETVNKPLHQYLKMANFVSISNSERQYAPYLNYVDTVYNGVDFSKYKLSDGKGEYLLFSGRIVKEKGIEDAIELSQKTGIPLKIAGIKQDVEYFDKVIKPQLSNSIEYVGNLAYAEYAALLKKAKALMFLIHWAEPFGLSALDALASGVPVVGYNKGSVPEVIYEAGMGLVVSSVDEAVSRIPEIEKYNPTTIRNLAYAKFSREEMAKGYLSVYQKILTP